MTEKYDEIRANVQRILEAAGITCHVSYVGATERPQADAKPWKCDAWRVTFKSKAGEYGVDYYTGLGHRKPPPWPKPFPPLRPGTIAYEDYQRTFRPQPPHVADVLHSLVLDAGAETMCFRDWANDCGYSDDSIKALEVYRACCEIGLHLRRVFGREVVEALRSATEEL
jgi:hypothetical protein